jgi:hypothetical protein
LLSTHGHPVIIQTGILHIDIELYAARLNADPTGGGGVRGVLEGAAIPLAPHGILSSNAHNNCQLWTLRLVPVRCGSQSGEDIAGLRSYLPFQDPVEKPW